ncbi:polysaccharide deacetylase family protein, partial [Streptomyces sp. H27-D2]|nr:polysaccharide deacetylase family protein [Streptomyces sp. H27-D2]
MSTNPAAGSAAPQARPTPAAEPARPARCTRTPPVPILMYHAIARAPAHATYGLSVTPEAWG